MISSVQDKDHDLQSSFLVLRPRIEKHARIFFRDVRCHHRREDAVSETLALAWLWFVRLTRRGKDVRSFVSSLATLAARNVRRGRRLCGQDNSKDVMSGVAQQRHRFSVSPLPHGNCLGPVLTDALADNTVTPPDEQAGFRIDFGEWRSSYGKRDRAIMDDFMLGERLTDVSRRFGLSPGRVSQLRRAYCDDWHRFHGEAAPAATCAGTAA
jgi:DNA-directed RNA polymerase specialized sigma24 family protein